MEVFDAAFQAQSRERVAARPNWAPPPLAHVALSAEQALVWRWMDETVGRLPEPGRSKLADRLRQDDHFITAFSELSAAAAMIDEGLQPLYEPSLEGKTPDFYVPETATGHPLVIDVWTRQVPQSTRAAWTAWDELRERIKGIPVGVGMTVGTRDGSRPEPPSSGKSKRIALVLRHWLLRAVRRPGDTCETDGLRFQVFTLLPDLYARLASPAVGGSVDSSIAIDAIRDKVRRYRPLCQPPRCPPDGRGGKRAGCST